MIPKPAIDRDKLVFRWVHLGNGHFFRAHQIYFNDLAIQKSQGQGWACAAIGLRSSDATDKLNAEKNLFTISTEKSRQVMGSLLESLHLEKNREQCIKRLLSPETSLVTLTITEKGYALGEPALILLKEVCERRFQTHKKPLVFLSCDNLQKNSEVLKNILLQSLSGDVKAWVSEKCFFPCSMVDRIVPHFSENELKEKQKDWGYFDPSAIFTEEFAQWIIEDQFGDMKPNWAVAGVQFVSDVTAFEKIKLQVLNASHSWLAYRGILRGYSNVADCMKDQALVAELKQMIEKEIGPCLEIPNGFSLKDYSDKMLARFSNPSMNHKLSQIAMDGTVKISQRWLPTLAQKKSNAPLLLMGFKAWFQYLQKFDFKDPKRDELLTCLKTDILSCFQQIKLLPSELLKDDQIKALLLQKDTHAQLQ